MSSLNRLLNHEGGPSAPSLAPPPPPPPPAGSTSPSFAGSALDFLAEAAMAGFGGEAPPPPAAAPAAAGKGESTGMEGIEPSNGPKPATSKQYHLDSSFFPAAPEPSFLPPPQQQRAAFTFAQQQPSSSSSSMANGHLPNGVNGQYNPVPNFNFAATAAAQQQQGQQHPSSSSSSDPSDIPIPAHLLAWGAEEPLSAAERVKMGRRRVPTVPAPAPASVSGPPSSNHHAHAPPHQQHSQTHASSNNHTSHSNSHSHSHQQHNDHSSSNHSHSHQQQQQQQHHQQQQAHNSYSNSSSSSSVPQYSQNPLGLLPMLPKKEKKVTYVPPPAPHSMNYQGGQQGQGGGSSSMSSGGTPNGMVRQGYQGERTTSIGSEGASISDSGTNTSSGNVQGQGHPVGPDGQPIVKTGRKRVLGPDGKPMKKVKVPGRGQAWRKGLGGVGTGSAAPKLSTPLELFTAPSGPPRPKKPKKIKNPEDANGGSGSGSANGAGNHNGGGGGGGGSHNFNQNNHNNHNHGNDPSGSSNGHGGGGGGGNNSMPAGEKLPKAPKPKVSKPGTHPKKAMPKFGPELPPNWIPTNLPIAQRPRDPTPPPVLAAVEEVEDDQAVYCICETKYDEEKAMIACDKCQEWYHPECVGISEEKIELVDQFVCPKCHPLTEDRTTWKIKCRSQGCFRPIIPPLTKYCSPSCGVTHLTALAAAQAVPLVSLLPRSTYARRPGGITAAASEQQPPAPLAPALSSSPSSGAAYPPSYPSSPEDAHAPHPLLTTLRASLEAVEKEIKESKTKVEVVGKRLQLLGRASDRAEKLEEEKVRRALEEEELKKKEMDAEKEKEGEAKKEEGEEKEEEEEEEQKPSTKSSSSKGKKPEAAGNAAGERVCGFDSRLVLGEREFEEWCATEEGKKVLAGEEVKAGEDVVMKEEGEKVQGGWWCEETRKKCDGHAGWQRWRLVDFQMEQQQKEETLSKLEKKRDGVKKEIHELEQEVEARRRLDLKPRSSTSNGFVAVPTSNERGGVAIAVERRASFNSNGLGVPSALINPFSRGGSASAGGQSSSLEGKGSYGSLYGFSNERGGFSSNERGGGGFSSERGGFSNERGGVSNERGGDEDVEMDMDL